MRYTRYFLLAATLPVALFWLLGLYLQPLTGDLTRLGKLSERDFGWNVPQPAIDVVPMSTGERADVVVLGDSFSESGAWQSVAARQTGLAFATYHWQAVGSHDCLDAWMAEVKKAHPLVRFIVIQTVERMFVNRFAGVESPCHLGKVKAISQVEPMVASRPTWPGIELPDAAYALRAAWNATRRFDRVTRSSSVYIAPLVRRDLFSSRRPALLLFYKDDLDKAIWRASDLAHAADRIRKVQAAGRAKGIEVIISVVPDKSTAYAAYLRYPVFETPLPDVWEILEERGVEQVNLRQALLPKVASIQDLYLPDNTHVGAAGYQIIGKSVAQRLGVRMVP